MSILPLFLNERSTKTKPPKKKKKKKKKTLTAVSDLSRSECVLITLFIISRCLFITSIMSNTNAPTVKKDGPGRLASVYSELQTSRLNVSLPLPSVLKKTFNVVDGAPSSASGNPGIVPLSSYIYIYIMQTCELQTCAPFFLREKC